MAALPEQSARSPAVLASFPADSRAPLLDEPVKKKAKPCLPRLGSQCLQCLSIRSVAEFWKVTLFILGTFLANSFFVLARNVGIVLFMHDGPGAAYLTIAMVVSGLVTIVSGQCLAKASKGVPSTSVYKTLLLLSGTLVSVFYVLTYVLESTAYMSPLCFAIFVVEDLLSLFIAMQQSTVAQSAFSVTDAKRLFGLVQLGNSIAAMSVGMTIGAIVKAVGTKQLLALQAFTMVFSLVPNSVIARRYVDPSGKKQKKLQGGGAAFDDSERPWWHNFLVLSMAFWGFTVVFAKTMYEFEYNILVAESMSAEEMVALTGYLYAGAGLASSAINLFGTSICLNIFGVKGAIFSTPSFLLISSLGILAMPGIWSTFFARLVDLSLRWSLNNTVRSVLWMAVPVQQAAAAKPWVEGTIKKLGSTVTALFISVVLALAGGRIVALSWCSIVITGLLFVCCCKVHSLYMESMWLRIKRRELKLVGANGGVLEGGPAVPDLVSHRLLHGGVAEQLYILREAGEVLSTEDWDMFFCRFHEWPTAVQVKAMEISRTQPCRIGDDFLLDLIREPTTKPAVRKAAIIAVGERGVRGALELLQIHLGNEAPPVQAAAATAILKMGWGLGLGHASSAAQDVLEGMLGFPLAHEAVPQRPAASLMRARTRQLGRGRSMLRPAGAMVQNVTLDAEELIEKAVSLRREWQQQIKAGHMQQAVALAIELTYVEAASLEAGGGNGSDGTDSGTFSLSVDVRHVKSVPASKAALKRAFSAEASPAEGCPRRGGKTLSWLTGRAIETLDPLEDAAGRKTAIALDMLQNLPSPRELIESGTWLELLRHPSQRVKISALAFVNESDATCPYFQEELEEVIHCLAHPNTYRAAEAAVRRLKAPAAVLQEVSSQLRQIVEHLDVSSMGAKTSEAGRSVRSDPLAVQGMSLLKYIQRQRIWCTDSDMQKMTRGPLCDELFTLSSGVTDIDFSQQMVETVVELKARGFTFTKGLAEKRATDIAGQLFQGVAAQLCLKRLEDHLEQLRERSPVLEIPADLRKYLGLQLQEPAWEEGESPITVMQLVLQLASRYIEEHVFLEKLQLLLLSVLASTCSGFSLKQKTVFAAWRALRSQDKAAQAAVLEVLGSILPPSIKSVVLLALGDAPPEEKLRLCATISTAWSFAVGEGGSEGVAVPSWVVEWFASRGDRMGEEFGVILQVMVGAMAMPALQASEALVPKLLLLTPTRLCSDLLATHVAALAQIAEVVEYSQGAQICKQGETYVVAAGQLSMRPLGLGATYQRGDVIQELHALCNDLRSTKVVVTSSRATLLRIRERDLFGLMIRLPPKFALSILKALVRILSSLCALDGSEAEHGGSILEGDGISHWQSVASSVGAGTAEDPGVLGARFRKNIDGTGEEEEDQGGEEADAPPHMLSQDDMAAVDQPEEAIGMIEREAAAYEKPNDEYEHEHEQDHEQRPAEPGVLVHTAPSLARSSDQASFTTLEKLLLLQTVKIFRYVTVEYLPSLASCMTPAFFAAEKVIFHKGESTNSTLYIIAEGVVGLFPELTADGPPKAQEQRRLHVGDSMGNTALLLDSQWEYSAKALEDSWVLCLTRSSLTDLLRGRRDLASAVIRGLYRAFRRRMQQAADRASRSQTSAIKFDTQSPITRRDVSGPVSQEDPFGMSGGESKKPETKTAVSRERTCFTGTGAPRIFRDAAR